MQSPKTELRRRKRTVKQGEDVEIQHLNCCPLTPRQPFPCPGSRPALVRVYQLGFHMIQRWESITHIRRPAQGYSAAACTALPAPTTASGAPCTRRFRSGHRGRAGASHPSSQTYSRRAGCIQVCGVLVSNLVQVESLFFATHVSLVLQTKGCEPSSGHKALSLNSAVYPLSVTTHTKPRE